MGLIIFFVHYYIFLRVRKDRRVQNVKLLLLTATKEGPVVDAIERAFASAGVRSEELCVARAPGRPEYQVRDLFDIDVATKPDGWKAASLPERACMAAAAMQEYLWSRWESAQILFILPGEREVCDVRNALSTRDFGFDWEPYTLLGETPDHEIRDVLERL